MTITTHSISHSKCASLLVWQNFIALRTFCAHHSFHTCTPPFLRNLIPFALVWFARQTLHYILPQKNNLPWNYAFAQRMHTHFYWKCISFEAYAACVCNSKSVRISHCDFGLWIFPPIGALPWIRSVDKVCGLIGPAYPWYDETFQCEFPNNCDVLSFFFSNRSSWMCIQMHGWSRISTSQRGICLPLSSSSATLCEIHARSLSLFVHIFTQMIFSLSLLLARYLWPSRNLHIPYELFLLDFFAFVFEYMDAAIVWVKAYAYTALYTTCKWLLLCFVLFWIILLFCWFFFFCIGS